ncbi:MAG: hypothetical protein LBC42_03870 [Puniceicoccales bacterium]|nr:hypothetical protein [Puniceicoccales bacterium]
MVVVSLFTPSPSLPPVLQSVAESLDTGSGTGSVFNDTLTQVNTFVHRLSDDSSSWIVKLALAWDLGYGILDSIAFLFSSNRRQNVKEAVLSLMNALNSLSESSSSSQQPSPPAVPAAAPTPPESPPAPVAAPLAMSPAPDAEPHQPLPFDLSATNTLLAQERNRVELCNPSLEQTNSNCIYFGNSENDIFPTLESVCTLNKQSYRRNKAFAMQGFLRDHLGGNGEVNVAKNDLPVFMAYISTQFTPDEESPYNREPTFFIKENPDGNYTVSLEHMNDAKWCVHYRDWELAEVSLDE